MGRDVTLLRTRSWGTSAEAGVSRSKVGVVFFMNFASGDAESFELYSPIRLMYNKSFHPQRSFERQRYDKC